MSCAGPSTGHGASPSTIRGALPPGLLCERQDMEELDVEPVFAEVRDLRNPVPFLEAEEQLLARVLSGVELVEPEGERRRLLTGGERHASLDIVRPVEVGPLA